MNGRVPERAGNRHAAMAPHGVYPCKAVPSKDSGLASLGGPRRPQDRWIAIAVASDDEWRRILRVNLRGTFLCCRAAARVMIPRRTGAIVTISSSIAYTGMAGRAHYAASKAAVSAFTRSLALELAGSGIRANVIAPGAMDTPMPRKIPGRAEADVQRSLLKNPLGQIGTAQDVAELILFLLSARSRHITGQVIHINGGGVMP
jgi:NAD(P)-dependent dehydrogenase (short-subunit alcohol dehydrogenase family)